MKIFILFITLLLMFLPAVRGGEMEDLRHQIEGAKQPALEAFRGNLEDFAPMLVVGVDSHDEARAATSLIVYWLSGGESARHAELIWWRSKSPALRRLAAALLLTGKEEQVAGTPFLDPTRFQDEERRQRQTELTFVEKHEKEIGAALRSLIKATEAVNPNEYKEALKLRFSSF